MAFLHLVMCRDIQSRLHLIYLYMSCVVDRVRVRALPYFLLLLLEHHSGVFRMNIVHSCLRLDSYP